MPIIFNPAPIVASTVAMQMANRRRKEQEEAERVRKANEAKKIKDNNKEE